MRAKMIIAAIAVVLIIVALFTHDVVEGTYSARDGQIRMVFRDGRFESNVLGMGTYVHIGSAVILESPKAHTLSGEMTNRNTVLLTHVDGTLAPNPIELKRVP